MGSAKRPYPAKLPEKLKQLRDALGLSQSEIALHVGVKDRASISLYENGERDAPMTVVLAYARLAKIPMETLVDDEMKLPKF